MSSDRQEPCCNCRYYYNCMLWANKQNNQTKQEMDEFQEYLSDTNKKIDILEEKNKDLEETIKQLRKDRDIFGQIIRYTFWCISY